MNNNLIYAAIAGDMAGSTIERTFPKTVDFWTLIKKGRFTDDTVLTIAVLDALKNKKKCFETFKYWTRKYPYVGFSSGFKESFIFGNPTEGLGHSTMNGGLMMLSPAIVYQNKEVLFEAVNVTHNASEVRILAEDLYNMCTLLSTTENTTIAEILKKSCISPFLNISFKEMGGERKWDMTSFGTLREAYIALKESTNFYNAVERALILGGDADTRAAIIGPLAAARFGLPLEVKNFLKERLPKEFVEII